MKRKFIYLLVCFTCLYGEASSNRCPAGKTTACIIEKNALPEGFSTAGSVEESDFSPITVLLNRI